MQGSDPAPLSEQAEVTLHANYTCTVEVCQRLFPLLKAGARYGKIRIISVILIQ